MFRLALPAAAVLLLVGTPARAQGGMAEIDRLFDWATEETPGCVVGVARHGELVVHRAYGMADLERGIPLTTGSMMDAGSVQKQFTAAAVLVLAAEGRLSLSDDIRSHVPELPDYGHTITLDHLLTHTSGVRDWTGMLPLAEDEPPVLELIVRQRGLNFAPGEEWSYSSSGFELLKEVVARASGMSFGDFVRERLFEPLGMTATEYRDAAEVDAEGVALAYAREGESWRVDMLLGNDRGGGALLTTAGDLVTWNEALTRGGLGPFVTEKIQEPARLGNGRELGYGRGQFLDVNRGGRVLWHTGGAAGYSAFSARYPEQGLSIAMMCNADGAARTAYARQIYDLFVPSTVGARDPRADGAASADGGTAAIAVPARRAGLFFSERDRQALRLVVQDGRLGIAGGGPLMALGSDRFRNPTPSLSFMSQAEFELHFVTEDEVDLRVAEGETTRYRRARPFTPGEAELNAFAGVYWSDELGATLEMVPREGKLVMRVASSPEQSVEITPADHDTFMMSRMIFRFVRDGSGAVIGFDYSNPVVRNVRFSRVDGAREGR